MNLYTLTGYLYHIPIQGICQPLLQGFFLIFIKRLQILKNFGTILSRVDAELKKYAKWMFFRQENDFVRRMQCLIVRILPLLFILYI